MHFAENGNGLPLTITTASGTISFNTGILRGTLSQLWVKPTTDSTTYDVKLTDRKSRVVRIFSGYEGTLNELSIGLPVQGKYTFTIYNASADEAFEVMMVVDDGIYA